MLVMTANTAQESIARVAERVQSRIEGSRAVNTSGAMAAIGPKMKG